MWLGSLGRGRGGDGRWKLGRGGGVTTEVVEKWLFCRCIE